MTAKKFFHSVYLNEERCRGCLNCIKRCPTQAIRVRNGRANIISEYCIDCGECIRQCPHHAKMTKHDHLDVLEQFEYTVAIPAPSLYSQFNHLTDTNIVLTALLMMGFDDVFEVSGAAELISEATRKYIKAHPEKWPLISTACPTIERLIRVKFPNLLNHLLPILPPMEAAAMLARKKAIRESGLMSSQIGIIFISPCPSKATFVQEPLGIEKSQVDAVLSIKDVYPELLSYMKEAERQPKNLSISGKIGVGWGISGGEAAGTLTNDYLAADGIENVMRVLEDLEDEKFQADLAFIELNACNGGCVGGVLNVENPYIAKAKIKQLNKYMQVSKSRASEYTEYGSPNSLFWTKPIEYEPVYQLGSNMMESFANLSAVEKLLKQLPGLDCGACGAPTCRALAEDIVMGKNDAKKDNCIYLLRNYYDTLKNSPLFKEEKNDNSGTDPSGSI